MACIGRIWPVAQVTWDRLSTRVRGVSSASMRSTFSCADAMEGVKAFTTMPSRRCRASQSIVLPTCSWVVVITSSPGFRGSPLQTMFEPSVVLRVYASSSASQPSRRPALLLISCHRSCVWPTSEISSRAFIFSCRASIDTCGEAPRPPVLRYVLLSVSGNC